MLLALCAVLVVAVIAIALGHDPLVEREDKASLDLEFEDSPPEFKWVRQIADWATRLLGAPFGLLFLLIGIRALDAKYRS